MTLFKCLVDKDSNLLSQLIDRGDAIDESGILLDLFAYFGQTVLEFLEHDFGVSTEKSRVDNGLCF